MFPQVAVAPLARHVEYGKVNIIFGKLLHLEAYGGHNIELLLPFRFEVIDNRRFATVVKTTKDKMGLLLGKFCTHLSPTFPFRALSIKMLLTSIHDEGTQSDIAEAVGIFKPKMLKRTFLLDFNNRRVEPQRQL
jgi:hypothetical protein